MPTLAQETIVSSTRRKRSWVHDVAHQPRRLWLRRMLFQVHLWAGLLVGLLATVIGLSGSAIVFREPLEAKLEPALYRTAHTPSGTADLDAMLAEVRRALPGHKVLDASPRESGVWVFRVDGGTDRYRTLAFVDPSGNRYLGAEMENKGFLNTVAFLHYELLGGEKGRIVNGIGALLLFAVSLTGVVLWWPGRRRWRRGLKIDLRARPARLNWDLHTAGGFYSSVFLLLLSLSGAYFCLPVVGKGLSILTGGTGNDFATLFAAARSTSSTDLPNSPLQPIVARSNALRSGYHARYIEIPRDKDDAITVFLDDGRQERTGTFLLADFDSRDGHLLRLFDSSTARFGVRLMFFFGPLHFGTFGGLTTKVLWVVLGLSPGVLFFTGFTLWWKRVVRKRFVASSSTRS